MKVQCVTCDQWHEIDCVRCKKPENALKHRAGQAGHAFVPSPSQLASYALPATPKPAWFDNVVEISRAEAKRNPRK